MNKKIRIGLSFAKAESHKSRGKIKIGCVIIKSGNIIGRGYNNYNTSPSRRHKVNTWSIHAEVAAINSLKTAKLKNTTMYIYRETKKGLPALAKPCNGCQKIINNLGIRKIIYTGNKD